MQAMNSEHYAIDDSVLSSLDRHLPVPVRIDIDETGVKLFIGPREYEWPRGCPDVCWARTESYGAQNGPRVEDL